MFIRWEAFFNIFVNSFRTRARSIHYLVSVFGNIGLAIGEHLEVNSFTIPDDINYPNSLGYKKLIKCLIEGYMLRYENESRIKEILDFDLYEVDYNTFIHDLALALKKYLRSK